VGKVRETIAKAEGNVARLPRHLCEGRNQTKRDDGTTDCRQTGVMRPNGKSLCDAHWEALQVKTESERQASDAARSWLESQGLQRKTGETQAAYLLRLAQFRSTKSIDGVGKMPRTMPRLDEGDVLL